MRKHCKEGGTLPNIYETNNKIVQKYRIARPIQRTSNPTIAHNRVQKALSTVCKIIVLLAKWKFVLPVLTRCEQPSVKFIQCRINNSSNCSNCYGPRAFGSTALFCVKFVFYYNARVDITV